MADSATTTDADREIAQLRAEVRRLRSELSAAERRNDQLHRRYEAEQTSALHFAGQLRDLRNSKSWRLTLPLRLAMRRVR